MKEIIRRDGKIEVHVMENDEQVYYEVARDMFDTIAENNRIGKKTVFIVPVGPVNHYSWFVEMVNRYKLSLKDVYLFNMDEYLTDDDQYIPIDSPLSFRGFMEESFYSKICPELNVPEDHRFFPEPGNEGKIAAEIEKLGGVDVCYGGMGITGHIAFNEPPEEAMSAEDYMEMPTRILDVSMATRVVNAMGSTDGDYDCIPKRCITIGMKDILASRRIHIMMTRQWQKAIFRKAVYGPMTAEVPGSLLQSHPNARLTVAPWVAESDKHKLI